MRPKQDDTPIVRPATREDFARIAEMGAQFWAQCTAISRYIPYDGPSVEFWSDVMLTTGVLLVVEIDGKVQGAAGCVIAPSLGNVNYKVGAELFWWIEPAYRRGGVGKALFGALELAARKAGCKVFSMMAIEGIDTNAVQAIYENNGYERTERSFSKGFDTSWHSPPQQ